MTPKEKAKELTEKFYQNAPELFGTSKAQQYAEKCALEVCNEILSVGYWKTDKHKHPNGFYSEVKQEIEKI